MNVTRPLERPSTRPFALVLEILRKAGGPPIATEPLSLSDLADCFGELWME